MPIVRVSRAAVADLLEIRRFAENEWGSAQANRYIDSLKAHLGKLAQFPSIGTSRPEIGPNRRTSRYGSHLVLYREIDGGIEIRRIVHAQRDLTRILVRERGR
jgi:toxin ParE1/3/4